jgi:hypothetical protein
MCVIAEDIQNYTNERASTFTCNVNDYTDSLYTVSYTVSDYTKRDFCSNLINTGWDWETPNLLVYSLVASFSLWQVRSSGDVSRAFTQHFH